MFQIGEKVVCVDDSKLPHTVEELNQDCPNWVKKGVKYTIRGFNDNNGIVVGVLLEEIRNPIKYFRLIDSSQEPSFKTSRFEKTKEDMVQSDVKKDKSVLC